MFVEKIGITLNKSKVGLIITFIVVVAHESHDVFLVGDDGGEIVAQIMTTDFGVAAKTVESVGEAETDAVGNIAGVEIIAAKGFAFNEGDFLRFTLS